MKTIKTDEYTIKSGHLSVSNGHNIWYEQWGNPKSKIPVLSFHGGPGSQYKPHHKYNFDPEIHQVISFDQRGCGNSLPYGELKYNNTQELIKDAKLILEHLNIEKVYLFGGSWGSTMALLFNIDYPDIIEATIIRGIFTGTKAEISYVDKGLFKNFYPAVWERFVNSVPKSHKNNPAKYHYRQLNKTDNKSNIRSSKALEELEWPLLGFDWLGFNDIKIDKDPTQKLLEYDFVPYKIYAHYMQNNCFLSGNYIIENCIKIKNPVHIVQGRYDMVCPPITAYNLHKTLQNSELYITLSSHGNDPETRSVLKTLIKTTIK